MGKLLISYEISCKTNCSDTQVLAATQMPEDPAGWFQGTADAIRKFAWVLEVLNIFLCGWSLSHSCNISFGILSSFVPFQDYYNHKDIEHIVILSGDQLYRMNYMELVQVHCTLVP
jgi:glucose-1-phosphate adenylyltransferase